MRLPLAILCALLAVSHCLAQKVVCIDPGHPSEVGSGTTGKKLTEIHVAWEVAIRLKKKLESHGIHVVLTKKTEKQYVKNRARAEVANKAKADLMVRLHCDASELTGFATYYPDKQGKSAGVTGPSPAILKATTPIAIRFHNTLAKQLKGALQDNGLKSDRKTAVGAKQGALTGSVFSKVPIVLVEMVVLTNPKDEAFISTEKGLDKMSEALMQATLAALKD